MYNHRSTHECAQVGMRESRHAASYVGVCFPLTGMYMCASLVTVPLVSVVLGMCARTCVRMCACMHARMHAHRCTNLPPANVSVTPIPAKNGAGMGGIFASALFITYGHAIHLMSPAPKPAPLNGQEALLNGRYLLLMNLLSQTIAMPAWCSACFTFHVACCTLHVACCLLHVARRPQSRRREVHSTPRTRRQTRHASLCTRVHVCRRARSHVCAMLPCAREYTFARVHLCMFATGFACANVAVWIGLPVMIIGYMIRNMWSSRHGKAGVLS